MKAAISSCSRAATTVIFLLALTFLLAATPAFAAVDLFVSPSSGSGTTGTPQTFVFTYTNANGFADINAAQMYFNTQPNYVGGCSVWYDNRSNWLFLFTGGSNNSWDGPATPGTVATLNSDQCSIDASQTSVSNPTANQLAISLSVTFKPGFVGSKNVYAGMQSLENVDSGWKPVGTWTPGTLVSAGPTATASNGTGNTGTLSVKLTSPNGYAYLNAANLIVNSGLTYQNGCVLWYDRPSNGLYMWNGSGWDAPLTIGVTGTLSSAQCSVNTGSSTVVPAGNDLTLNLAITFANGFIGGGKNVYGWVGDRANADNGLYPQIATWTPTSTAPSLVSVTAGSTVSVVLADVNGYSYINAANIVINKVLNWANSCTVWYDLPSNNLYLWNGGGWDISPLGAGGTTLANSQCSLNGAASTMTGAGNTLTLNLALNFTPTTMTGVQNVYVWSNDKADASTGFQTSTTTITPNLPIVVTLLPNSPQNMDAGQSLQITPTVANDAQGVNLTVNPPDCGTVSATKNVPSGTPVTFTTPFAMGTPCFVTVTATSVTDPTKWATLNISVYQPLTLPFSSPNPLPPATTGQGYNGFITASGGVGPYTWTVTGLSDNLTSNASTNTSNGLAISGSPTSSGTVNVQVSVKDSTGATTGPNPYSIVVSDPIPLTIQTPINLPPATVGQSYNNGFITAQGGSGTYTWTATPISGSLPAGLSLSNLNGSTLQFAGTVQAPTGSYTFTVQVTDGASHQTSAQATIIVNPAGASVTGNVSGANNSGPISGVTISINTTPVQTTTTDGSGNFSLLGIPDGSYVVSPSFTGSGVTSVFYPASQNISVNGNDAFVNFQAALGYTVSGTVSYAGSKTGTIYITLQPNNSGCNGTSNGTSISSTTLASGGNFTISGVCPGTYSLSAWMDRIGLGVPNGSDPYSTNSPSVTVPTSTNPVITITDQPNPFDSISGPAFKGISPMSGGVLLQMSPVTNSKGVEMPPRYQIQWSTDSTFATGVNHTTVLATGGNQPYILNSRTGLLGLTDGAQLYFQIRGESIDGTTAKTLWTVTPTPVPIGAATPTNPVTVQGNVNYTGPATTGPLYTGCFDQNTGTVYGESFDSAPFPQPYSVAVTGGTNCYMFGIIDNNNDSAIDPGDVSNTDGNGGSLIVTGTGPITNDINLPNTNSVASITTSHSQWQNNGVTGDNYSINFDLRGSMKLPVAVQLVSGPNVLVPMDIAPQQNSKGGQFQLWSNIGGARPTLGDIYGFKTTYSDGSIETVNATVTTVLDAFAKNLTVDTTTSPATATMPTFKWAAPDNPPTGYTYQFRIDGPNGTVWQVPSNNSNVNGLDSSVTSLVWGVDPTDGNNKPTMSTLSGPTGTQYMCTVTVLDKNGNSTQTQIAYILP